MRRRKPVFGSRPRGDGHEMCFCEAADGGGYVSTVEVRFDGGVGERHDRLRSSANNPTSTKVSTNRLNMFTCRSRSGLKGRINPSEMHRRWFGCSSMSLRRSYTTFGKVAKVSFGFFRRQWHRITLSNRFSRCQQSLNTYQWFPTTFLR